MVGGPRLERYNSWLVVEQLGTAFAYPWTRAWFVRLWNPVQRESPIRSTQKIRAGWRALYFQYISATCTLALMGNSLLLANDEKVVLDASSCTNYCLLWLSSVVRTSRTNSATIWCKFSVLWMKTKKIRLDQANLIYETDRTKPDFRPRQSKKRTKRVSIHHHCNTTSQWKLEDKCPRKSKEREI